MNNQAIELREGDELLGVGEVLEVTRRKGWVRVTCQPAIGTAVCFDLPSTILVETDRPIPQSTDPRAPWQKTQTKPKQQVNPTPIPVVLKQAPPATESPWISPPSSATGESTAPPVTTDPVRLGDAGHDLF